jgi:putative redox protein
MTMEITFPGGDRVEAAYRNKRITTDQDDSAPAPFELFLASIATCAGLYVARFCEKRGIPARDVRLIQRSVVNRETHMVERIEIDVRLPEGFPERYREAVVRAAQLCAVKKHLEMPPVIEVRTTVPTSA